MVRKSNKFLGRLKMENMDPKVALLACFFLFGFSTEMTTCPFAFSQNRKNDQQSSESKQAHTNSRPAASPAFPARRRQSRILILQGPEDCVRKKSPLNAQQKTPPVSDIPPDEEMSGADGQDGTDGDTVMSPLNINPTEQEEKTLLAPSADDFARYKAFLKSTNTGLIRLLPREKYEGKLRINGSGAYYSFARRVQAYGHGSDIELQNGRFKVGFAGGSFGFFAKLGNIPLDSVNINMPAVRVLANPNLDPYKYSTYSTLKNGAISYDYRILAELDTTYILRSINPRRTDVLVAFRPVRKDKDGSFILLWKMLGLRKLWI